MRFIILAAPLVMTACAGGLSGALTPEQAVIRAAAAPIAGTFVMTVRGTGRQDFLLYLNSQADYRDQRNLSVEVRVASNWRWPTDSASDRCPNSCAVVRCGYRAKRGGSASTSPMMVTRQGNTTTRRTSR